MKTFASQLSPSSLRLLRIVAAVASSLITVIIVADPSSHSARLSRFGQATETIAAVPIPFATTFTVNSVNDNVDANVGDGHCDTDGNLANGDQCTLRAAIQEGAFSNQGHSINFDLPAGNVITLNTALPAFVHDVSIVGPGSSQLTIQRSTAGGTPNFTIFSLIPINGNFSNSISGLTIANGNNLNVGSTFPQGGCLYNASSDVTTLTDVTFRGCASLTNGGGIYNGGTLALTNSTVTSNSAGSPGGGIYNTGTLTVNDSTVSDNSVSCCAGGGIANAGGTATVTRSTVSGNNSGGIANLNAGATFTLTNSTVSGNTAFLDETGGIKNSGSGAVLTLTNSTVTANTGNGFIASGGILNDQGTVNLGNSIVAKNTGALNDVRGTFVSQGYNLIGVSSGDGLANGMNHDQVGGPGAPIDPLLGPLANNGGVTRTHAPLVGSPAIDRGNSSQITDQRGQARPVDDPNVTNAAGGNATDVGAYETNPIQVNTIVDADDGQCGAVGTGNGCTLREAIIAANAAASSFSDITFAPALTSAGPVTIDLLIPLPALSANLNIQGTGSSLLTVRRSTAGGTPDFRIFTVNPGKIVNISGVTITNGDQGGVRNNQGALSINNCVVTANSGAAGLYNNGATLTVNDSTVSNNTAGGIDNEAVTQAPNPSFSAFLTVNNSTISGNSSTGFFGAILNVTAGSGLSATAIITNSTISGNSVTSTNGVAGIHNWAVLGGNPTTVVTNSTVYGNNANGGSATGGISNDTSSCVSGCILRIKLINTIVAGNLRNSATPSDISGAVDLNSLSNLIGTGGNGGLANGFNGNQVGVADAKLGPLTNNGGPTQTHALLPTSPAFDGGDLCVVNPTHCSESNISRILTDQRGFARLVDGPDANINPAVDIGAFEAQRQLADLPDSTINEDASLTVFFDPGDTSNITSVTPSSSDGTLVPNDSAHLSASLTGSNGSVVINPAADLFGTTNITVTVNRSGGGSDSKTFALTVNSSNDAPSFTKGPDQIVNEDAGAQTVNNWATGISPGPANESGQVVNFQVTGNTNTALFSASPVISSTGTLTFTPVANASGSAIITVKLQDFSGTANGGVDTSAPQTFTITVSSVNDAPSFTKGPDQTVNEDASAQTVNNWATAISPGPANESGQTLSFNVTGNTNSALFLVGPAISSTGTLTYTPAADANGSATITINLQDNGGTANGGVDTSAAQTFTITVNSVNDAPSFTKGADQTVNNNAGGQSVPNWATAISAGPANESAQTLTFQITNNTNAALFSVGPSVSSTGTLTYTPAANAVGTATITVLLQDNGGTANGGVNVSPTQTFNVTVNPPGGFISFASASSNTTESSGAKTLTVNRTGDTTLSVNVDYATSPDNGLPCSTANGVATPKCDFTTTLGTLNFAASETSKTITIPISQDSYAEGPETFTISLSNPTGGSVLGTPAVSTITITDDATEPPTNPIDDARNFVRQHYHDFLNREPDQSGWDFWTNQITSCGSNVQCNEVKRIDVSASFFLSIEFQQTGYLVERFYKVGYGDGTGSSTFGGQHQLAVPIVRANEFLTDTQRIGRGVIILAPGWEQLLESNKQAYALEFVQTVRFTAASAFPTTMTPAQFVDKLNQNAGSVLSPNERTTAINFFGGAGDSSNTTARAQAVRQVAEDTDLFNAESNRAFVLAEYFGYLRRNPNDAPESTLDYTGFDFWLTKLNQFNGNYINAEMVKAFLSSIEYRQRFGQ